MADEVPPDRYTDFYEYKYILRSIHPHTIPRCAFTWHTWELEAMTPPMRSDRSMDALAHLGVKEVSVIVGEIPKVHNDLVFVPPGAWHETELRACLKSFMGLLPYSGAQEPIEYSWRDMELKMEQYLRRQQTFRSDQRRRAQTSEGLLPQEFIDRTWLDPARWPVSGVKFVELK